MARAAPRVAAVLLPLLALQPAWGKCVFYQDCVGFPPECIPQMYDEPVDPFPLTDPFLPCPEYVGGGCCMPDAAGTLYTSLQLLVSAFGDINSGGCPACLANAASFWCEYTCSPYQDEFFTKLAYVNATDPNSGNTFTVLQSTIRVDKDFACGTYDSCASTSTVRKDSTLASMEGFFTYQGNTEAIGHGQQILFDFVDAGAGNGTNGTSVAGPGMGALGRRRMGRRGGGDGLPSLADPSSPNSTGYVLQPLYSCCNFPLSLESGDPLDNATNTSCPCASCGGMCAGGTCPWDSRAGDGGGSGTTQDSFAGLGNVQDNPLLGFDTRTVGIFYGCIATILAGMASVRYWRSRKGQQVA